MQPTTETSFVQFDHFPVTVTRRTWVNPEPNPGPIVETTIEMPTFVLAGDAEDLLRKLRAAFDGQPII